MIGAGELCLWEQLVRVCGPALLEERRGSYVTALCVQLQAFHAQTEQFSRQGTAVSRSAFGLRRLQQEQRVQVAIINERCANAVAQSCAAPAKAGSAQAPGHGEAARAEQGALHKGYALARSCTRVSR